MQTRATRGPATAAVLVLAGGNGVRVGAGRNKTYLPLGGRAVVSWSLNTFASMPEIGPVVLVIREEDRALVDRVLDREVDGAEVEVVIGGPTRQSSELAGLRHLADRIGAGAVDIALIHDGARPLIGRDLTVDIITAARANGGATPGLRCGDLAWTGDEGAALAGPATGLVSVQTPQAFRAEHLLAAYEEADRHGFAGTDTVSCVQRFAPELLIKYVDGDQRNFKITYAHDLVLAELIVGRLGHRTP